MLLSYLSYFYLILFAKQYYTGNLSKSPILKSTKKKIIQFIK